MNCAFYFPTPRPGFTLVRTPAAATAGAFATVAQNTKHKKHEQEAFGALGQSEGRDAYDKAVGRGVLGCCSLPEHCFFVFFF